MVQYAPMNPHFISKPNPMQRHSKDKNLYGGTNIYVYMILREDKCSPREDKILTINFKVGVISLSHSGFYSLLCYLYQW